MTAAARSQPVARPRARSLAAASWATPVALFAIAFVVRIMAASRIHFPMTEGSAYYVEVAGNVASGRGLVIDSIWSYATPPLSFPRPAFELWQPLASLVAALPMTVLGEGQAAAGLAFALLGALVAPLAWYVGRDAAARLALTRQRATMIALGAGLLAAVTGPLVFSSAVPDSTLPFTVTAVAACAVMPAALTGRRAGIVALGVLAGLAYLARMEAVYLAIAFVVLALGTRVALREVVLRGAAVAAIAALVALPWWLRNLSVFGTALPGQVSDNAFLTRNEQIFAWADRPTLEGFLAQGPATILANITEAYRHDIVDVLIVPAAVAATIGIAALVAGRRHAGALRGSPLAALLVLGVTTLVVTSAVFPVATLWGTFEHAAGPLIVALCVLAAVGAVGFVARVRQWRNWPRENAWLAPTALLALTIPLTLLQLTGAANQAASEQRRFEQLGRSMAAALDETVMPSRLPIITDRPIWLAQAIDAPTLALPDEPVDSILDLARTFGARVVVVVEQRGPYPQGLAQHACFESLGSVSEARVFVVAEACR